MADQLEKLLGKPLPVNSSTVNRLLGSLTVDNSLICQTLNWQPPYTIDEGFSKSLS